HWVLMGETVARLRAKRKGQRAKSKKHTTPHFSKLWLRLNYAKDGNVPELKRPIMRRLAVESLEGRRTNQIFIGIMDPDVVQFINPGQDFTPALPQRPAAVRPGSRIYRTCRVLDVRQILNHQC